jgi:acetylornithine deacetylase/succinyl-diaminopimelate desuccinylase family protein
LAPPSTEKTILDTVSSYRNEIVDFTKALVSVPTENPPGSAYSECAGFIEDELNRIGLDCSVIEAPSTLKLDRKHSGESGRTFRCSILSYYGTGKRTLYFHGHYDVVPASSEDQFRPRIIGDKLVGRGSSDMKGGLAAMIYAVKAVKECGIKLDGRIGLTIVPDEETGGLQGSKHLADIGLLGKDGIGMLTPEPTSGVVWNANRGAISLRVDVKGKAAHVGAHYEGINAFEQMLTVAEALRELKEEISSRKTSFRIEPEAARSSILMMGGQCEGGTVFNVVPGTCSFTVDRRINPEEDLGIEKRTLLTLFDELRNSGIDLEANIFQEGESAGCSDSGPLAEALAGSVEDVVGKHPAFAMCPGLLEIRFYIRKGVPAFAYGPGLLSVSHGPDEFVRIRDVYDCAAIYALAAARLLSKN